MLWTLDQYLDAAKTRREIASDRELSVSLGFHGNMVTQWRCGRAWPSDSAMVTIAELAGVNPHDALLHLNVWRAKGKAKDYYLEMLKRVAAVLLMVGISTSVLPEIQSVNKGSLEQSSLYIMENRDTGFPAKMLRSRPAQPIEG